MALQGASQLPPQHPPRIAGIILLVSCVVRERLYVCIDIPNVVSAVNLGKLTWLIITFNDEVVFKKNLGIKDQWNTIRHRHLQ
ncbi:MAG TPA: hypothetical protein VL854_00590 [Nitrososphaeraceae archaeon]|nr:hypothetical protein [Nitrososphaeraceae archaeon]